MEKTEKPLFANDLPPHVRSERQSQCLSFIHRCGIAAEVDEHYEHFLLEIMNQAAESYILNVKKGNIRMARNLPLILNKLTKSNKEYGDCMTPLESSKRRDTKRGHEGNSKYHNTFIAYFLRGKFWDCGTISELNIEINHDRTDVAAWRDAVMKHLRNRCGESPTEWHSGLRRNECKLRAFQPLLSSHKPIKATSFMSGNKKKILRKEKSIPFINASPGLQWKAIKDSVNQALITMLPKSRICHINGKRPLKNTR